MSEPTAPGAPKPGNTYHVLPSWRVRVVEDEARGSALRLQARGHWGTVRAIGTRLGELHFRKSRELCAVFLDPI